LGEKKGASKGKLANCTKMPAQPDSAMRGLGAMRVDKAECAAGRLERCGAMVVDIGGEKGATQVEMPAKKQGGRGWS
jgi:hypothetical protein